MSTPPGGQPPYDPDQPRFDPETGQPIGQQPQFDPETGQPIGQPDQSSQPGQQPPPPPPSAPGPPPGQNPWEQQPQQPAWDQQQQQGWQQQPYPTQGPAGYPGGAQQGQQNNALALTSLITGILSIPLAFCCLLGLVLGPAAVITGWLGMKKADESQGRMGGKGMAKAGLICGIVSIVLTVVLIILWVVVGSFDYQFGTN